MLTSRNSKNFKSQCVRYTRPDWTDLWVHEVYSRWKNWRYIVDFYLSLTIFNEGQVDNCQWPAIKDTHNEKQSVKWSYIKYDHKTIVKLCDEMKVVLKDLSWMIIVVWIIIYIISYCARNINLLAVNILLINVANIIFFKFDRRSCNSSINPHLV